MFYETEETVAVAFHQDFWIIFLKTFNSISDIFISLKLFLLWRLENIIHVWFQK